MRVVRTRQLFPGNLLHTGSVLRAEIEVAGFVPAARRWAAIMASVPEFVSEPPGDPAAVAAAIADLTSALLQRIGETDPFRRQLSRIGEDPAVIAVAAARRATGVAALEATVDLLTAADDEKVAAIVATFERAFALSAPFPDDVPLIELAASRGIRCRVSASGKREILLGEGRRSRRILSSMTDRTGFIAAQLCASKRDTHRALRAAGFPTPDQRRASGVREACEAASRIGYPVVVKPERASRGIGVTCCLTAAIEVAAAFRMARRYGNVVVERFIDGDDHRMLVVGGRLVSCARRRSASVVGDGASTVDGLVARENARPERQPGPRRRLHAIVQDAEMDRMLALQSLTRTSVVASGKVVRLRSMSNWSQGGYADSVLDRVHPLNARMAVAVARHFGMDVVGVDMISTDISRPLRETGGAINEVQRQPAISPQRAALGEAAADLYQRVLDHLTPADELHRIPVLAVLGGDADAVAERLAGRLSAGTVGVATRHGLRIGGRRLSSSPHLGRAGMVRLLDDPTVDAVVVAIDAEDLILRGLGHDRIDVAAIAGPVPDAAAALIARLAGHVVCMASNAAAIDAARGVPTPWSVVDETGGSIAEVCANLANGRPER